MAGSDPETPLQRRMREVEEQRDAVRQRMRDLEKQVKKLGTTLADTAPAAEVRTGPRIARSVPGRYGPQGDELTAAQFLRGDRPEGEVDEPAPIPEATREASRRAGPRPAPGMEPGDRFASYLATGSFGGPNKARPLSRERRMMRNKALFMLIIVLLAAMILYRLLF